MSTDKQAESRWEAIDAMTHEAQLRNEEREARRGDRPWTEEERTMEVVLQTHSLLLRVEHRLNVLYSITQATTRLARRAGYLVALAIVLILAGLALK